jgi:hypothetical protein
MGQRANSGRQASLDDKKERMAGRVEQNPQLNAALDPDNSVDAKGKTPGAFGKDDHAHRNQATEGSGSGGGGGMNSQAHDSPLNTGASRKTH